MSGRDPAHRRADQPAGRSRARRRLARLARHSFTLADGHRVGLAVSGRGVPLVVVHGFTAEGFLYAQTLHRLVGQGLQGHRHRHGRPRRHPGPARSAAATSVTTPS